MTAISAAATVDGRRGFRLRGAGLLALGLLVLSAAFAAGAWLMPHKGSGAVREVVNAGQVPFLDVSGGSPAERFVAGVWRSGLMLGTSAQTFDPERAATRGEAAVVIVRCARGAGYEVEPAASLGPSGHWAAPWLAEATQLGLMASVDEGDADAPLTRADLAALLTACMPLTDP